jgi:hypothetical protein
LSIPNGVVEIGRVGYCKPNFTGFRCDRNVNSPLKNPFGGKNGTINEREGACNAFKLHFSIQMGNVSSNVFIATRRLLRQLKLGKNILLQCHCVPLQCHCETIKEYLDKELAK